MKKNGGRIDIRLRARQKSGRSLKIICSKRFDGKADEKKKHFSRQIPRELPVRVPVPSQIFRLGCLFTSFASVPPQGWGGIQDFDCVSTLCTTIAPIILRSATVYTPFGQLVLGVRPFRFSASFFFFFPLLIFTSFTPPPLQHPFISYISRRNCSAFPGRQLRARQNPREKVYARKFVWGGGRRGGENYERHLREPLIEGLGGITYPFWYSEETVPKTILNEWSPKNWVLEFWKYLPGNIRNLTDYNFSTSTIPQVSVGSIRHFSR